MALYAFDGTWNVDEENPEEDTNVVRFGDLYSGNVEPDPPQESSCDDDPIGMWPGMGAGPG